MNSKEMKELVGTARSYERSKLWMEKVLRLENQLEQLKKMGAADEWIAEQTRHLELQRAQTQYLRVVGKMAHERLQHLLGSIEDEYMYQIITRHYLQGHSWQYVARALGGGNTADSVRKAAARYLSKLKF